MSGTASGWTPVGPAGGGRWELLVFCCIWLGLRARCAGIGTGKESGRMVFTDVDNYKRTSSVTKIIEDLKWDTLQKRRTMARLTVLHKETHSKIPSNIHHLLVENGCKPQTRQHHSLNYNTIQSNKDCYRYSLYPRTIPIWNSLSPSVKSATNTCNFKLLLASVQI